jgi:methionyl-tRNA formyltransferase
LLRVNRGEVRKGESRAGEGSVVWVGSDFIEVQTGNGSLLIREIQVEGKRKMSVRDFLSGHPIPVGTVFH